MMKQQLISSSGHNRTDLHKKGFFLALRDKLTTGKIKLRAIYIKILNDLLTIHPGCFRSKLKKFHTLTVSPNVLDIQSHHVTGLAKS